MVTPAKINEQSIVRYIEQLVTIPSPTGYTRQLEQFLLRHAQERQIVVERTKKGAVMYKFEASEAESSVMFTAHIDTLGGIVTEVRRDRLKFLSVGHFPALYVIGDYCQIHTFDGKRYQGTILPNNPAAHVNHNLDKMDVAFENLSIRVDLPVDRNDLPLTEYIEVGNFISFDPRFTTVEGFVKSRHLDDKASAAILLHVADLLQAARTKLNKNIYLFFNITEETGQGISGFPHLDDLIIVDMGVVGDGVAGDEFHVSICAKDSSGPYNYELTQQLVRLSKDQEIAYKVDVFPYYGSDGSMALRAGADLRVALIGPGVSASHGYERTHAEALKHTVRLIWAYLGQECLQSEET